jgi:protein-disulfide isomerase
MPPPRFRFFGLAQGLLVILGLSACRPANQIQLDALALRVDSLAHAITILGERAGLQNAARPEIRIVTTAVSGGLREGAADAPFVLVEFTDYYCPYCATFAVSTLPDIVRESRDLEVVIRNYPIAQIHPEASRLASVVECVADADPTLAWALHHHLFARQASLDSAGLAEALTAKLGTTGPVAACAATTTVHSRVERDLREAERLRLRGTPALILGRRVAGDSVTGMLLPGAYPAAEVLRLLDSLKAIPGPMAGAR